MQRRRRAQHSAAEAFLSDGTRPEIRQLQRPLKRKRRPFPSSAAPLSLSALFTVLPSEPPYKAFSAWERAELS